MDKQSLPTDAPPLFTTIFKFGGFFGKMRILNLSIKSIKPYENNPRINDEAVKYVANSIKEFGFKVPIVIDKDNVIVTGHTRFKASQMLGLTKVPCIRADDLTPEQVKAFRIADNSVSEIAKWNNEKLLIELEDIDFDMDMFGLEINLSDTEDLNLENPSYFGEERDRTNRAYNLNEAHELDLTDDFWQFPVIRNDNFVPNGLIGFNYALSSKNKETGVHFYIDDYQFERIWSNPEKYIDVLREYECILTPDFSLYIDMPMPMKIWNIYRSRFIGAYYQRCGLKVIPTVSWAEKETFEFCFRGIEKESIVSISTIGIKESKEAFEIWECGTREMISQLNPSKILVYGGKVDFDFGDTEVIYFENEVTKRLTDSRKEM